MTLSKFNLLAEEEQYKIVFNQGTVVDIYVAEPRRFVLYAVEKFIVEVELDRENKTVN